MMRWKSIAVVVVALIAGPTGMLSAAETYETLQVGETAYRNVTVVNRTPTDVFIRHAGGLANLKVQELAPELLVTLGYSPDAAQPEKPALSLSRLQENPRIQAVQQQLTTGLEGSVLKLHQTVLAGILIAGFVLYLFVCYCLLLICRNAGHEPGAMVWLPVLQLFPMLRAAGMPSWWFFVFLAPSFASAMVTRLMPTSLIAMLAVVLFCLIIGLIGSTMWCLKIARACGKSTLVGVLLLLPITSFFAFLYLAFSGPSEAVSDLHPIRLNLNAS